MHIAFPTVLFVLRKSAKRQPKSIVESLKPQSVIRRKLGVNDRQSSLCTFRLIALRVERFRLNALRVVETQYFASQSFLSTPLLNALRVVETPLGSAAWLAKNILRLR